MPPWRARVFGPTLLTRALIAKAREDWCYTPRHEPCCPCLERSPTTPSVAPQTERLVAAPDRGSPGISEGAVSQWIARARRAGPEALRRHTEPGVPRQLSAEQLRRLPALLRRGPAAYGFRGDLWPRTRIAAVIRLEFGGSYHPTHVGRLCNQIRWSPPNPARRARQRNEAAITHWRKETLPAIKGGRKPGSKASSSESGFSPLPSVVRTYAQMGQTPVLRAWWTRDHLSAISALSPEGRLYFHCQERAFKSDDVVALFEHLLREVPNRLVIIWDGSPVHRSHTIREFLANGAAQRLHMEHLPAYAPELNPGKGLRPHL